MTHSVAGGSTAHASPIVAPLPATLPARPEPARAPAHVRAVPPTRPSVRGRFLFVDGRKLHLRGVTYGTLRRGEDGGEYGTPAEVAQDFARMAASGVNAVRTYTTPPGWLLDLALEHRLYLLVGLPWEQHVAFLDEPGRADEIVGRVRACVRGVSGHAAVLGYTIGNEIPASIVRWHGARRIERFLRTLYRAVKEEDPGALVTYVNFPTTEYLRLPFLDFVCFNVYLESHERLQAYLARLHVIAGDKPLVMAELGLDSRRNGEVAQAKSLDRQVRTAFASGCAGVFVFSWTDEWHRGGQAVEDWDFGLTRRDRTPKPALFAVERAFAEVPFPPGLKWPRISVVVCSYNGARTLDECLSQATRLDYPDYEVVVVNDGSTDATAGIALRYRVRLINLEKNGGLSHARNIGIEAATGEIVAFLDDDAYPDAHWLSHLAYAFLRSNHAGVGGPNLPPAGDGWIAEVVALSPGGPLHVLVSDEEAEHIPGCNSAYRRADLLEVGGFDPQFRTAGDDVDLCWRLLEKGKTIGFSPAAVVWHHRRGTISGYLRQQQGYGKAEAFLERKWPRKFNALGHVGWTGRLYAGVPRPSWRGQRIYQGTWGCAPFQSLYEPAPGNLQELAQTPEWVLVNVAMAGLAALGFAWPPLLFLLPLLLLSVVPPLVRVSRTTAADASPGPWRSRLLRARKLAMTALLHALQPVARLVGRFKAGLTPWRGRTAARLLRPIQLPFPQVGTFWSETWRAPADWLEALERALVRGAVVLRGGAFDRWDLEARAGILGGVRMRLASEEHGGGKQLLRMRIWPRFSGPGSVLAAVFGGLSCWAASDGAVLVAALLAALALVLALEMLLEFTVISVRVRSAFAALGGP